LLISPGESTLVVDQQHGHTSFRRPPHQVSGWKDRRGASLGLIIHFGQEIFRQVKGGSRWERYNGQGVVTRRLIAGFIITYSSMHKRSGTRGGLGCAAMTASVELIQGAVAVFIVGAHAGIAAIWLYGLARPRFRAGTLLNLRRRSVDGFAYWVVGYALAHSRKMTLEIVSEAFW